MNMRGEIMRTLLYIEKCLYKTFFFFCVLLLILYMKKDTYDDVDKVQQAIRM